MSRIAVICLAIASFLLLAAPPAFAADVPGSGDHPLVPRYPASEITAYEVDEFNEYGLLTGPVKIDREEPRQKLEGRVTTITYDLKADRSTLEVFRNYELALDEKGFEVLFSCKNAECGDSGGRRFNHAVAEYDLRFGDHYADQRYLAAHLVRPTEGDLYVSLYMVKWDTKGGSQNPMISIQAHLVEIKPMEVGMELKLASEMQEEIVAGGRVVLYGIHFDFDSDRIKAESKPTLEEIAKFLKTNPPLRVLVVGHTDTKGSLDYNLDLSRRRARSVVAALSRDHGITAGRLEPHGVGFLAPVASNRDDAGRALNRRVELVEH